MADTINLVSFLLVSKNPHVFENSRKRDHESFHTLNTIVLTGYYQQRVDVYLFPSYDSLRTEKRKEREKKIEREREKNKTKIREMDNKNPAIWRERCTRARMLLISPPPIPILPKFTIWPWASRIKPTLKRFDRQPSNREREKEKGMAVAKTSGNQRKTNKEWERRGNAAEGVMAEAVHARYFPCLFSITPREAAVRCRRGI